MFIKAKKKNKVKSFFHPTGRNTRSAQFSDEKTGKQKNLHEKHRKK